MKFNILIIKDTGMFYGSLEKLLRLFAKALSKNFNVFFAYAPQTYADNEKYFANTNVTLIPFTYAGRSKIEPYSYSDMQPALFEIINKYHINCIYTDVFAHYQFPMNTMPASIPFVLISPFGHYATNGAVYKAYVSGQSNVDRLKARGISNVEVLYNPVDDFAPEFLVKPTVGNRIVFGRIGRGDDNIFDPISVKAFKKLEDVYGDRVKYIVVNAPPAWKALADDLKIKNMEFRSPIAGTDNLAKFYQEIDVFAHARVDGETVGMAIAEAMLAGNPILTHKSRFHNDHLNILDKSYSKWCEPDDDQKYFENMQWMVENKNQIRAMGQLARKRAYDIFVIEAQLPGILKTFTEACKLCSHYSKWGRFKGYVRLYWENFKSLPFFAGKKVARIFPALEQAGRKFYHPKN